MQNCLLIILCIVVSTFCQQKVEVDTDYSPLNFAVSMEYEKCKEMVQIKKCNNVDQWQSVIEELKQENDNSEKSEIPFLVERKKQKVENFAKVLNKSQSESDNFNDLTARLKDNQQKIMDAFYFIEEMYKVLPQQQQPDFIELKAQEGNETAEPAGSTEEPTQSAAQLLNSDVPDLAKQQLNKAKKEYDIADQSIQAQTASNILRTFDKKMTETLNHVNEAYNARSGSLQQKKEQVQGDILKARVMIQNEQNKQGANNEKITKLQGQIEECEGMPTDELKDCNPIKVNASKLLTEIEIIQHLGDAVKENLSEEDVNMHIQNLNNAKDEAAKQAQIDSYLKDPEVQYVEPKEPNELHPIHHLKDNLPEQKEKEKPQEEQQEEPKKDDKAEAY